MDTYNSPLFREVQHRKILVFWIWKITRLRPRKSEITCLFQQIKTP